MQVSEPFLPFSNNLLYKRVKFDDKLDLINKIIPIDQKACFLIDSNHNLHLKAYFQEDEKSVSLQFPLPPYAHKSNPKVLYSVDYFNLFRYLYKKKPSADLDERRDRYIQFSYLGDYKLAVQLDKRNPVMILDLQRPKNSPVVLEDVFGVENLISVGNSCLAWYESDTKSVILYHYISRKRKILNFAKLGNIELHSLKDHVIVAIAKGSLEVLDYARNKIIKSVCFMNGCPDIEPDFAIHSEGNIISYIDDGYIYVFQTEEGKIKWENHYECNDYDEIIYVFIANNLIAVADYGEIQIFLLDSQTFSLHTKIQDPQLGTPNAVKLGARCCESASKEGFLRHFFSLGGNSFGMQEILCGTNYKMHGYQRVTQFILEDLKAEDAFNLHPGLDSIKFQLRKSILFEEYRDSVRAIDILDETLAMFITERGRIFEVNLKNYSAEYITELRGLIKKKKPDDEGEEMRYIDKFFALGDNKVAISTKVKSSQSVKIAVVSLKTRTTEWSSFEYQDEEDSDEEVDQFSFYDMVKLSLNEILVSYKEFKDDDDRNFYQIGKVCPIADPRCLGRFNFSETDFQQRNEVLFDRLWNIEGELIAMRHREQVYHLSFLDLATKRFEKKLEIEKYISDKYRSYYKGGVCDLKLIQKNVISISLTTDEFYSFTVLLYNLRTEELLNTINASGHIIIGTIRQCFREHDIMQTMTKMIIFGSFLPFKKEIATRSLHDAINKKINSVHLYNNSDFQPCVSSKNFKSLPIGDQALIYENYHNRNFVCVLKPSNFKLECLRILQKEVGNTYHEYIYRDIVNMIFGVV